MIYNQGYYNDAFLKTLESDFGSYNVYDNGVIEAKSDNGDILLINTHSVPNDNATLVNLGCGWGNVANTYQYGDIIKRYQSDNPPDYFVTIPANCRDSNNVGLMAMDVFESLGHSVPKVQPSAYSGSGAYILQNTISLLREHPDVEVDKIILNETDLDHFMSEAGHDLSYIKNKEIPIILNLPVDSNGKPSNANGVVSNTIKVLANQGIDVLVVTSNTRTHEGLLAELQSSGGIVDCAVSGDFSKFEKAYKCVDGKFVEVELPTDFKHHETVDALSLQILDSDIRQKYLYLRNTSDVSISFDLNHKVISGGDRNISCDIEYLASSLGSIKSQIRSSGFLNTLPSIGGATGVLGAIGNYFSAYFDMVGSLCDSLNQEVDAIASYGQYYVDFDRYMSGEVENLIGAEGIIGSGLARPLVSSDASEEMIEDDFPEVTGEFVTELAAFNSEATSTDFSNLSNENVDIPDIPLEDEPVEDDFPLDDSEYISMNNIIDSESNLSVKIDDSSKLSFDFDDNNIMKATYSIDYASIDDVYKMKPIFERDAMFKSVSVSGNRLNIVLDNDFLTGKTLDEVKKMIIDWMDVNGQS